MFHFSHIYDEQDQRAWMSVSHCLRSRQLQTYNNCSATHIIFDIIISQPEKNIPINKNQFKNIWKKKKRIKIFEMATIFFTCLQCGEYLKANHQTITNEVLKKKLPAQEKRECNKGKKLLN